MTIRIDAKGKYYTDIIRKDEVPVLIQTVTNLIHGNIFLRPEQRVKDGLNEAQEAFIAVSEAQVFGANGQVLYTTNFLTVNKQHIVWLTPEERQPDEEPESAAAPEVEGEA
jgi:hypothetical protein